MKIEYPNIPESLAKLETYGFSWMDFVTAIPAPLFLVTSYKSNGKANACMQSWACFNGSDSGFYAIVSNVSKSGHLYSTLREKGEAVLNFPSADIYDQCMATIANNKFEDDEIEKSGLTAEPAAKVDAPRVKECFMNLECRYLWEKEIKPGDSGVLICLEVINICVDADYLDEGTKGRYGDTGYLYNIHYPVNPEKFNGKSNDFLAVLKKLRDMGEY